MGSASETPPAPAGRRSSNSRLRALHVVVAAVAAAAALLVQLPWEPGLDTSFPYLPDDPVPDTGEQDTPSFTRSVVHIPSHGEQLEAWLYLPKSSSSSAGGPPPVLVMAHGMGAQKDIGLAVYAEAFVQGGMAVLVFDYRTFGGSSGLPRHWVSPRRHNQDYAAVLQHVQATSLGGRVDASRVALWGVSYGGGHVLVTAATFAGDMSIRAVVANEPYVSPAAVLQTTALRGVRRSLRLLAAGLSDELRRLLSHLPGISLPPVYLRLVAPLGDATALALLPLQDSEMALRAKAARPKRQGNWQNKVLARVVLEALNYNPAAYMGRIRAALFVRVALQDHLCPPDVVRAALQRARLPEGQFVIQQRNVTHLEAHSTGVKPEEVAPVISFLRSHLGLSREGDAGPPPRAAEPLSPEAGARLAEVQFPSQE